MASQINNQQLQQLKGLGYSDEAISLALKEIEEEDQLEQKYNNSQRQAPTNASYSSFSTKPYDDVARLQIELNDLLEKTEHILKGDIIAYDNGRQYWAKNPTPEENPLNDLGIRLIMEKLNQHVNKNTILSDYEPEEINLIVLDFGKELNNLLFKKYEEMGLDTEEKRKQYSSIVWDITAIVRNTYSRAKFGRERDSYRKMTTLSLSNANSQVPNSININSGGGQKTRSIFNPMRYIAGKDVR